MATGAQLAADYPQLASWIDIGDSWEKVNGFGGDDLMVMKITNSAIGGDKPKLFAMGSIHAREYVTAEVNTRFAEYLLQSYGTDPDATWLVDHHEIHLLLIVNPDGRRQAQTGDLWRKNTNQNFCGATSSSRGADLNRNFEYLWNCCGGSSSSQCSDVYRGPAAGSEPETDAVMTYVRSIFDDVRGPNITDAAPSDTQGIFIDVHSFGGDIFWPWGALSQTAPNGAALQTLGRRFAWFAGYRPAQAIEYGVTDGATDDFAYGDLGIAGYTFELGTSFFQDCGSFESTIYPDNLQALIYAARTARAPYLLPSGPDALNVTLSNTAVAPGTSTGLTVTIDDTRFGNSNGTEPTQNIAAARYTIDTPPWAAGATPVALTAADGSFNTKIEVAQGTVDTTGLSNGQHTIFVEGQDTSGSWGPVGSTFLFVIDPVSAPRISGTVIAADTGLPLAATISAGTFSTANDPATGNYELVLVPGTYDLLIVADDANYGSQTVPAISVEEFDTATQNVALSTFCTILADDMETTDTPWNTTGSWGRTQVQANSPTYSYADSPSGNYGNNSNSSLTSPALDLTDLTNVNLLFASRCDTEATYDFCIVEARIDGNDWTEIARFDGNTSSFSDVSLSLESIAGAASARVRFRLDTDVSITDDGWYVDDVVVRGVGGQCATAADTDADGVSDAIDNCTLLANPSQVDTNGDGYGNACDPDLNNDNIVNAIDLGQFRQAFFSNGVTDSDFNADGVTNALDLGVLKLFFFGSPGPSALAN